MDFEEYERILKIISNMTLAMERSPKTFKGLDEEKIRDFFLVFLTGHYEGQAMGEAFNFEGKTDILVRHNNKNLFIAECAFWDGEKYFTEKIDQLLGYVCWRDTKTSVLIFNKNKDFSNVIKQIPEIVKNHPNFKRQLEYKSENGFKFILNHRDDKNKELYLTVLAFEVPQ